MFPRPRPFPGAGAVGRPRPSDARLLRRARLTPVVTAGAGMLLHSPAQVIPGHLPEEAGGMVCRLSSEHRRGGVEG